MARKYSRLTDTQIVEALVTANGLVFHAAKALGCDPQTIHDRRKKSEAIEYAIINGRGDLVDTAESALRAGLLKGEGWAVQLALKTIGKDRGYIERQELEHTGKGGGPVAIDLDAWRRDLGLSGGGDGSDR